MSKQVHFIRPVIQLGRNVRQMPSAHRDATFGPTHRTFSHAVLAILASRSRKLSKARQIIAFNNHGS